MPSRITAWSPTGPRRSAHAVAASGPGDVLIVAGKGHEQGQEIAGVKKPFDDRVVLRAALEASAGAAGTTAEKGPGEQ